jgi:glycosyltransferase involved in cell wall biosynthesis
LERVVFFNHLRQGSASNERQEGLGKYLRREGYRTKFVMRRPRTRAAAGVIHQASQEKTSAETRVFWDEPLELKFLGNLSLTSWEARGADIIHVNRASPYTSSLLRLGKWSSRGALVVDMEDWDGYGGYSSYTANYGPKGWLLNFFERTFPKTADAVIVVSELLRSQILKLGVPPSRVFKVPNGFDPDLFHLGIDPSSMRETYGLADYPVLMYTSAYWQFERAQHSLALSVFRRVCDVYPEARLLMVGAGDLNIGELVHEFRLDANVIVTGFVPRSWMPGLMAAADAVFHVISDHPFHRASSPMVVPEYMAMGKAIVAPRIGELATMLSSGAGALVEGWDPSLMADQLVRVLGDESLRSELGRRAAAVAKEAYSYEVGAATLREAYRVAVENRSSKRASD